MDHDTEETNMEPSVTASELRASLRPEPRSFTFPCFAWPLQHLLNQENGPRRHRRNQTILNPNNNMLLLQLLTATLPSNFVLQLPNKLDQNGRNWWPAFLARNITDAVFYTFKTALEIWKIWIYTAPLTATLTTKNSTSGSNYTKWYLRTPWPNLLRKPSWWWLPSFWGSCPPGCITGGLYDWCLFHH